jgi:3',5'-cyclic AMP phosphodiesterase CpdA
MRVAIVSDIHGNLTALEAVIADLKIVGADLIVQGGDLVGGSRNAEVIDLVRERNWPGVYGNAEEMLWIPEQVTLNVPGLQYERMRNVVLTETIPFICQAIGEERLSWLRSLPKRWAHEEVTVMHAGPDDVWHSPWANDSDEEFETSMPRLDVEQSSTDTSTMLLFGGCPSSPSPTRAASASLTMAIVARLTWWSMKTRSASGESSTTSKRRYAGFLPHTFRTPIGWLRSIGRPDPSPHRKSELRSLHPGCPSAA